MTVGVNVASLFWIFVDEDSVDLIFASFVSQVFF